VILSNFRNVERNAFCSKQCLFYSYKTLDVRPFRTSLAVYFYRRFLYLFLFLHFSDTDSVQDHSGKNNSLQREVGLRPMIKSRWTVPFLKGIQIGWREQCFLRAKCRVHKKFLNGRIPWLMDISHLWPMVRFLQEYVLWVIIFYVNILLLFLWYVYFDHGAFALHNTVATLYVQY
jgi:hypothetical protein